MSAMRTHSRASHCLNKTDVQVVTYPYYLLNLGLVASVLRPEAELWGVWYHYEFIFWQGSIIFRFYLCGCSLAKKWLCLKFWIPGNAGKVPLVIFKFQLHLTHYRHLWTWRYPRYQKTSRMCCWMVRYDFFLLRVNLYAYRHFNVSF